MQKKNDMNKISYLKLSLFFVFLFILAVAGFWNSYFSLFINDFKDIQYLIHIHALFASLWIIILIIQPYLLFMNKIKLHKTYGNFSKLIFILLTASIVVIILLKLHFNQYNLDISIFVPFKDIILLFVGAGIGYSNTSNLVVHRKGMILTAIAMIEPALIRLLFTSKIVPNHHVFLTTIIIIYTLLLYLILTDTDKSRFNVLYPLTLIYLIISHVIIVYYTL